MNANEYKKIVIAVLATVAVVVAGAAVVQRFRKPVDPKQQAMLEVMKTIASVGRLMVLPTNETPTVATVSDPNLLKGEEFFTEAKVGFKVLIYAKSGKAILYDPFADRIVNVAPFSTAPQEAPPAPTNTTQSIVPAPQTAPTTDALTPKTPTKPK